MVVAYPRVVIASATQTSRIAIIRSVTMIGMVIPRMTGLTSGVGSRLKARTMPSP